MACRFFFVPFVTISVAPVTTGIITHFMFHIRCIYMHKLLCFSFFSASFCKTFLSAGIATSISKHVFSFLFFVIISGLFAITSLSDFVATLLLFQCLVLCISNSVTVHQLCRVSLSTNSSPEWDIQGYTR